MTKRWQIFSVLACMFIVGFFYRVSMAVVSRDLSADLGLSAAQLGVLSGIFFYVFALAQIPLGPLIDRFGGRLIITILGIATTCGSLTFALAPNYPTALLGRGLLGLGTASVLMGSLKIFTNWFSHQEFPKVSGFMIAAGNLGSVSATAPLAFAISLLSWRYTFLAMTVAQGLATIAVFAHTADAPPGNDAPPPAAAQNAPDTKNGTLGIWQLLLSSPEFWLVACIAFFWYANYMVLLALWGGPYLMEAVGLGRAQAGGILMCTSVGFISGSMLVGKAIDFFRGSLEKTILCGQAILLLAMTVMLGPADHLLTPVLAVTYFAIGFFSASGTIIYPLARKLVPHDFAATAMTGVNFFLLMGAAVTQHVMGLYICSFPRGSLGYPPAAYHGAFLLPICGLGCTLLVFFVRKKRQGFDVRQANADS